MKGEGIEENYSSCFITQWELVNCFLCCTGIRMLPTRFLTKRKSSVGEQRNIVIEEAAEKNVKLVNVFYSFVCSC
jgi:hypothetical protein